MTQFLSKAYSNTPNTPLHTLTRIMYTQRAAHTFKQPYTPTDTHAWTNMQTHPRATHIHKRLSTHPSKYSFNTIHQCLFTIYQNLFITFSTFLLEKTLLKFFILLSTSGVWYNQADQQCFSIYKHTDKCTHTRICSDLKGILIAVICWVYFKLYTIFNSFLSSLIS